MPKEVPGQISSLQVTIGGQTVDPALVAGIMIKQCLSQKFGPIGRISVIDAERNLAKIKGDGSETAEVTWTDHNGQRFNFEFMVDTGQNIDSHSDGSDTNNSARKHNTYIFTLNGKDTKNVNGGVVYGAKNKPAGDHLDEIYKKLDSKPLKKNVNPYPTSINIDKKGFYDAIQEILNKCKVPGENSSYCMIFEDKEGTKILDAYENMFKGASVASYKDDPTNTKQDSEVIIRVSSSNIFTNPGAIRTAANTVTSQFNPANGGLRLNVPSNGGFQTLGRNPGKNGANNTNNTFHNYPDALNNRYNQRNYSEEANRYKLENLHLKDNSAEFVVFPQPKVDIGKVVDFSIPAKDDKNTTTGNPKINGKMLVRTIIHRIGAVGEEPRYTQVLQTLKGDPEGR